MNWTKARAGKWLLLSLVPTFLVFIVAAMSYEVARVSQKTKWVWVDSRGYFFTLVVRGGRLRHSPENLGCL